MSPTLNGGVATYNRACRFGLDPGALLAAAVSAEFGRARTTLTEAGTP